MQRPVFACKWTYKEGCAQRTGAILAQGRLPSTFRDGPCFLHPSFFRSPLSLSFLHFPYFSFNPFSFSPFSSAPFPLINFFLFHFHPSLFFPSFFHPFLLQTFLFHPLLLFSSPVSLCMWTLSISSFSFVIVCDRYVVRGGKNLTWLPELSHALPALLDMCSSLIRDIAIILHVYSCKFLNMQTVRKY